MFVFGALSVYLMSLCLKVIPIGTAHAMWGGIGAVGVINSRQGLRFGVAPKTKTRLGVPQAGFCWAREADDQYSFLGSCMLRTRL